MKLSKALLHLVLYPLISLVVVYGCLLLSDQNISRASFALIIIIALLLPVVILAHGIQKVFKPHTQSFTPVAAAISSLFWVIIAVLANHVLPGDQQYSVGQSVVTFLFYLISVTVILYAITLIKITMAQKKKQS